jgi:hypothetical protein
VANYLARLGIEGDEIEGDEIDGDEIEGDDIEGDDIEGDDIEGSPRVMRRRRRTGKRSGRKMNSKAKGDGFDRLYREQRPAQLMPASTMHISTVTLTAAGSLTLNESAPCDYVLNSVIVSDNIAASSPALIFTVGGLPADGRNVQVAAARFTSTSTNRTVAPLEVKAGQPVLLQTTGSLPAGTYMVSILGLPKPGGAVRAG